MKGKRRHRERASPLRRWVRGVRGFWHLLIGCALLASAFPRAEHSRQLRIKRWWSRRFVEKLGVQIEVEGALPHIESASLLVSNHVSWLDIHLLDGILPARYVAKSEIRDWPIAGWIAARAGTLFINRAKRRDAGRMAEVVIDAFHQGHRVGLFAEGTTTEGDTLLRFHAALFEPALRTEVDVIPVAIRYERADGTLCREAAFVGDLSFAASIGLVLRQRTIIAKVRVGEPVRAANMSRRELADRAHRDIASLLGLSVADTPPQTVPRHPGESR